MTKKKSLDSLKKQISSMSDSERKKLLVFTQSKINPIKTKRVDAEPMNSVKVGSVKILKSQSKNSIIINGIKIKLQNPDLDGNGVTGGEEKVEKKFNKSLVPIKEGSELGDAIKEQNKDVVADRLSSMDFGSRIDKMEMSPMVALDSLIGMGVIPVECGKLNRVKMRKSVSIGGEGRKEFVDLVVGKKEQDMKAGLGQKFGNFIGMGQKPEGNQNGI